MRPGMATSEQGLGIANALLKKQASPAECISATDAQEKIKGELGSWAPERCEATSHWEIDDLFSSWIISWCSSNSMDSFLGEDNTLKSTATGQRCWTDKWSNMSTRWSTAYWTQTSISFWLEQFTPLDFCMEMRLGPRDPGSHLWIWSWSDCTSQVFPN